MLKLNRLGTWHYYICIDMSKRMIWILGVFMALVMMGLIAVQAYWINNAVNIKEKQFSQLVVKTLTSVAGQMENEETAYMVYDYLNPTFRFDTSGGSFSFNFQMNTERNIQRIRKKDRVTIDEKVIIENRPGPLPETSVKVRMLEDSLLAIITENLENENDTLWVKNDKDVIDLPDPDIIEERFIEKQVLVEKVMSRIFTPPKTLEERLSKPSLENYIDRYLTESGLELDYEYAVVDQENQISLSSEGYEPNKNTRVYTARLFPGDIFTSPNYLRIYFPDQRGFIYRSVGFMGLSSVGMTIIIIGIFIFTLWIIFRQKKLSEMKTDFVNNMTHELKTPISTISLASQMLSDDTIPVENKNLGHISKVIDTESKRLGVQVEKVLQMAIFDKGKIKLKLKVTDLNKLIEHSVENFSIQVKKRGGTISWKAGAENSTVKIDEVHFTNVISNLVDNAIKYCRDHPEIEILSRNENNHILVIVKDNGIGISKQDQKRIFEKFYRVPTGNVHNVKGFGLGLSYVKKIIDIHEGSINLKSELNRGTRFEIRLPLYKA